MPAHRTTPRPRRTLGGDVRGLVRRYGWRILALPILTAITVAALLPGGHGHHAVAAPAPAPATHARHTASPPTTASTPVTVEGRPAGAKDFAAASTPTATPVVIDLGSDETTSCAGNDYAQLVLVSVSRQHLWACEGQKQVNSAPVTTGETDNGDHTPLGSWRVQDKQRDRYLVGPGYRDYVQYWVPYDGDFGLHDASWQTIPFGSAKYRTDGSHGCVHVPTATMAWLYRWIAVAKTVVTIEA